MALFDNEGREVVSDGTSGAPADAEFVVTASHPDLPNARVLTPLGPVSFDLSTPGQVKIAIDDMVGAVDGVSDGEAGLVPTATAADAKGILTGDAEFSTVSELLDYLVAAAAQGDILYRNGTVWTRLAAGTSGHFLKTLGAGANPVWAAAPARGLTTITVLTGSGTFTPQAGTAYMDVLLVGPGGGGGSCTGSASNAAAAGGGGSGALVRKAYTTNPGALSYSIGTGGAGGSATGGPNNGSAGSGASTFGSLSAGAGSGGTGSAFGNVAAAVDGGAGGTASGGDVNVDGEAGTAGITLSGTVAISGQGGSISPTGAGGNGRTTPGTGGAGSGTGSGGGGGQSTSANQAGGAGTNGTGVVLEYG